MPFRKGFIAEGNLFILPVCHYRMEFADHVRNAFHEIKPDVVAVELPSTLSEHIVKAVGRFPYLSVIVYQNAKEEMIYFPIEPTDPMCEGVRCALEHAVPVHLVDLDLDEYPLLFDPMPDSYAVFRLGLGRYWAEYEKAAMEGHKTIHVIEDDRRESTMAYHLQRLLESGKRVLFICGMAHVRGVQTKLREPQVQPVGKVIRKDIRIFNLHVDSIREVSAEIPFLMAVYEMERGKHRLPVAEASARDTGKVVSLLDRRHSEAKVPQEGYGSYPVKRFLVKYQREEEAARKRVYFKELMKALAKKLNLMPEHFDLEPHDGGDAYGPNFIPLSSVRKLEIKRENIFRFKTSQDRDHELMQFYGSLCREKDRPCEERVPGFHDRQSLILRLVRKAALYYRENTGEEIKKWQVTTMMKFARNYALVTGMLIADLYQLIMAARGVADDNFGYEIWDLGSYYPWRDASGHYETIFIHAEEVWIKGKRFTLHRRYPRLREHLMKIPMKGRKKERSPGEWAKEFDQNYLCSYPPEDIIIEGYGDFLKKKAVAILSEERARVEPFTNSLLDGIDVKETIRNWHREKKIYVRENMKLGGGAGSVVVIFDEDLQDARFPWKMTWLGEHHQESDMAFYATDMTAKIVGPGICRCEYGGFMLTHPPLRLYDVWTDPFYDQARKKSEVLLMAAIEYSVERHVVYVAAHPPRSWFSTFASRLNKKIVYIPIGQLSPTSLKKLRVFHVLSGHHLRAIARDYVW
jgi:hypothetical protein